MARVDHLNATHFFVQIFVNNFFSGAFGKGVIQNK
ncbi:hypothetical protein M5D96_013978 [Drosophila gunungcola]|uniref:Uncharacterized protein n=1 Tax=Drosophila gunungcola TaxID=103775 RepID=A0A9Q0BIB1_9MUSC|nr:hypothetical protein M5D96_013978 [Drosophila gunungcola]